MAADPDVIDQHPAIAEWAGQLRKLADATGMSLRQLAEHVPWSHSTLARYVNGERVVEEAWQLVPALLRLNEDGKDVDARSLREAFVRARQAYRAQQAGQNRRNELGTAAAGFEDDASEPAADTGAKSEAGPEAEQESTPETPRPEDAPAEAEPESDPQPGDAASERKRGRWPMIVGIAALAVLSALVGGFAVRAAQAPPREIKVWQARIVGTWSDQHQQHLGVFRFRSPDIPGDTDKATYLEQTPVAIVCQARHRRLVNDATTGTSSAVWNKLSDGYWIPDLYTDLPKTEGEVPPLGIPPCP